MLLREMQPVSNAISSQSQVNVRSISAQVQHHFTGIVFTEIVCTEIVTLEQTARPKGRSNLISNVIRSCSVRVTAPTAQDPF